MNSAVKIILRILEFHSRSVVGREIIRRDHKMSGVGDFSLPYIDVTKAGGKSTFFQPREDYEADFFNNEDWSDPELLFFCEFFDSDFTRSCASKHSKTSYAMQDTSLIRFLSIGFRKGRIRRKSCVDTGGVEKPKGGNRVSRSKSLGSTQDVINKLNTPILARDLSTRKSFSSNQSPNLIHQRNSKDKVSAPFWESIFKSDSSKLNSSSNCARHLPHPNLLDADTRRIGKDVFTDHNPNLLSSFPVNNSSTKTFGKVNEPMCDVHSIKAAILRPVLNSLPLTGAEQVPIDEHHISDIHCKYIDTLNTVATLSPIGSSILNVSCCNIGLENLPPHRMTMKNYFTGHATETYSCNGMR